MTLQETQDGMDAKITRPGKACMFFKYYTQACDASKRMVRVPHKIWQRDSHTQLWRLMDTFEVLAE